MKYRILQDGLGNFIPQKRYLLFFWSGWLSEYTLTIHGPVGPTLMYKTLEEAEAFIENEKKINAAIKKSSTKKVIKTL